MDQKKGGDKTADCIIYSISATQNSAPAYAEGICSLHLYQTRSLGGKNIGGIYVPDTAPTYTVSIDIFDAKKATIGHHDTADAGAGYSLDVDSKLPDVLLITPEERGDYVQFALGSQSWTSSDAGSCAVGDWDPKSGYPGVSAPPRPALVLWMTH